VKTHHAITLAAAALLASCGTGSDKKESSSQPPQRKSLNERFGGGGRDPNSFKQGADGKLEIDNAKRSQFENQGQATVGGKTYQKKNYRTGDYTKKTWQGGDKDYGNKTYAGPTDGSRFQTNSRMDGQGAPESGSRARVPDDYGTGAYATGDAREEGNMNRDSGAAAREGSMNNDQFQWDKQRDLTVDQSRSMLGH
jgi:hypothetical protein